MLDTRTYGRPVAVALGPMALGAVLGGQVSPAVALRDAALVPAIVIGLAAATVPALYIATVATGSRITAPVLARAVLRGLEGLGIVLLGLAAPLAFLVSTTQMPRFGVLLGTVAIGVAAVLGMRRMRAAMVVQEEVPSFIGPTGAAPRPTGVAGRVPTPLRFASLIDAGLFLVWGGVAGVLGAKFFLDVMGGP